MKLLPSLSRMSRRIGGSRGFQRGFINLAMFLPRWGSKRFDTRDLFRAGQQGFVFEPWDFANFSYQDSTGITPVTAVEQSRGMVLDKRLGAVRGAELRGNATLSLVGAAGAATINTSTGDGTATRTDINNQSGVQIQTVAGTVYEVTLTATASTVGLRNGSMTSALVAQSTGAFRAIVTATNATLFVVGMVDGATASFSGLSVKALPGNHAIQSTAASRPVVGARVNLLTKSDQFDDAAWTKTRATVSANATTAPDGSATADKLLEDATAANTHNIAASAVTTVSGVSYKYSVYAKAGERAFCALYDGTTGKGKYFSLPADGTGAVLGDLVAAPTSASISYVGSGWYLASIVFAAGVTAAPSVYISTAGNDFQYNGDVTKGLYVWGADLRTAGDAALAIPSYQRVNTATDYDTAGFPVREKFDGLDDYDTTAAGGGSTTGMFYCAAVTVLGGAGTTRRLWSDVGTNTGYLVSISTADKFRLSAANGTAFTLIDTTGLLPVGETHVVTAWDDGTNLNVQIDQGAVASIARPVVAAGTASITEGRDNGASTAYFNGALGTRVYRAGTPPDASQRAAIQRYIARKAGVVLA